VATQSAMGDTDVAGVLLVISAGSCSEPSDSSQSRNAAEAAQRSMQRGMSVADVVDLAAAQEHQFSVTGVCGSKGALNVRGAGGDRGLVLWRGSPLVAMVLPRRSTLIAARRLAPHCAIGF
jgi:hypothetical protein